MKPTGLHLRLDGRHRLPARPAHRWIADGSVLPDLADVTAAQVELSLVDCFTGRTC